MGAWWGSMVFEIQVFYAIGIVSSLILLAQMVLVLIGFDHDLSAGDADMTGAAEHPGGLHILSVRTVVAFFVGFGWTGVIALQNNLSLAATVILSVLVGGLFMLIVYYVMKSLHGMRDSGTLDYKNAIGKVGTVYLPIPPNRSGPGQIEIQIQGRLMVVQAYTASGQKIANHAKVKVVELVDPQTLLVEPLAGEARPT